MKLPEKSKFLGTLPGKIEILLTQMSNQIDAAGHMKRVRSRSAETRPTAISSDDQPPKGGFQKEGWNRSQGKVVVTAATCRYM